MPIQPINTPGQEGWQVRVGPRSNTLTKFFACRKHGGKEAARRKAEHFEALLLPLAEPLAHCRDPGPRLRPSRANKSKVVGLRAAYEELAGGGRSLRIFVSWRDADGKNRATSFSAQRRGVVEAVRLAMERRSKGAGVDFGLTPRQVWRRLKASLEAARAA